MLNILTLQRPVTVEFAQDYRGHKKGAKAAMKTDAEITTAMELARAGVLKFADKAVQDLVKANQVTAQVPGQPAMTIDSGTAGIAPEMAKTK